ncbi:MAG: hypothetical protein GY930_10240 [bacterium]|nr:hypothetical protein [bacterium]
MTNQIFRLAFCLLTLFLIIPIVECQEATGKSDLRVLLVSHDPDNVRVPFPDMADERMVALYAERAELFEAMLREHFTSVRMVYGADYTTAMSDAVDVTLFDARPKALSQAERGKDPLTGETSYKPAEYLPRDFDRPALMIAENSPTIGEPLGLKLDWL